MPAPAKGASLASLPNDVIFDILFWTPVKSVCRFRCVSRGWRALISDPVFIAAHRSHARPHLLLVANSSYEGKQGRDLRLVDMHRNVVKVIKEVGIYSAFCPSFDDPVCVTFDACGTNVVDLATGKVLMTSPNWRRHVYSYSFGFGRAIPSGMYKAVRFQNHAMNGHPQMAACEVLTLADGAAPWRATRSHAPFLVHGRFATTVNGALHFLNTSTYHDDYVLRFDLESEEWKHAIKGPLKADDGVWKNKKITQLNGTLCMMGSQPQVLGLTRTDIWLMTDYDKEIWIKAYSISTALDISDMMLLGVIRGKLLFCCYGSYGLDKTLQFYDPSTDAFTFAMEVPFKPTGQVGLCSLHLKDV